jgi:hypothetical protein
LGGGLTTTPFSVFLFEGKRVKSGLKMHVPF